MQKIFYLFRVIILLLLFQGCSGNGFHLRKNVSLANKYSQVQLQGVATKPEFEEMFSDALSEAGGKIVNDAKSAKSLVIFNKFEEGRRIIAYTSDRRAREFLVFLKIEYSVQNTDKSLAEGTILPKRRINIDRSYLYDRDFALGKAEEEKKVKQALYEEATRLILLRLKYEKDE